MASRISSVNNVNKKSGVESDIITVHTYGFLA